MSYDPILIAPYKSGLIQYYKPFLIGNDAFTKLENCYSQRGVVKKREGSVVLARTPAWRNIASITPGATTTITIANHGLENNDIVWIEGIAGTIGTALNLFPFLVTVLNPNTFTIQSLQTGAQVNTTGLIYGFGGTIYLPIMGTRIFVITSSGNELLIVFTERQAFLLNTSNNPNTLDNISFFTFNAITNVSATNPAVITVAKHSLVSGETVIITGTGIPAIDGIPLVVTITSGTTFTVPVNGAPGSATGTVSFIWTGNRDNFFYTSNYYQVMWTTNNVDVIRYFNGSTTNGWSNLQPVVSGTTTLDTALMVLPYKGRLVVLNTIEGGTNFWNRARWSQIGTPFAGQQPDLVISSTTAGTPTIVTTSTNHNYATGQTVGISNITDAVGSVLNGNSYVITVTGATTFTIPVTTATNATTGNVQLMSVPPSIAGVDVYAWREDIIGKGGHVDADTNERIVGATIIQDTLIVGFQFSTWRLRYTGNDLLPFVWERIDTQFGCEGTFTVVPFDDRMLQISRRGITGASFNDVKRIDMLVPDFVENFDTGNTEIILGINRIQGVRDFQKRLVYWIYCDQFGNNQTPNKILCYNYQDNTWATFNQSFTVLGVYKKTLDNIWSTWTSIWDGDTTTWETPLDQKNTIVTVAGDIEGQVWQIMNDDYSTDNGSNFNFTITTNWINPYFKLGKRCKLAYYDVYTTATDAGQVTLQNYTDDNPNSAWLVKSVNTNDSSISSNPQQEVKYVRVFLGMIARNHQISITLSGNQLGSSTIGASPFELQGIIMHTRMEGRIKQ